MEETFPVIDHVPPYPGEKQIHRDAGFRISAFRHMARFEALPKNGRWRSFSFYSLSILRDGKGIYYGEEGESHTYSVGDGLLVTPGMVHRYGGDHSEYVEDFICFEGRLADMLFQNGLIRAGIYKLETFPEAIMNMAGDPGDQAQLRAGIMLQDFLIHMTAGNTGYAKIRQYISALTASGVGNEHFRRIGILCNTLRENLSEWRTVGEMAESCHLSVNHFRNLFFRMYGMNPREWLEEMKISHSARLLTVKNASIEDIAHLLGYSNRFHFSKVFKRIIGISPGRYREEFGH